MDTLEEVVPLVVTFLYQRHFQLEFRVSHAFFRRSPEGESTVAEDQDSSESGSIDSRNEQFLFAEDTVIANLAGHKWKSKKMAPELDISQARRKNTAHFRGLMYATSVICKLASST